MKSSMPKRWQQVSFVMLCSVFIASAEDNSDCVNVWKKIASGINKVNVSERVVEWKKMKDKCSDQDLFQFRLASLKIESGDFAGADSLIVQELNKGSIYKKELLLKGVISMVKKATRENVKDPGIWSKILARNKKIVEQYPDWWEANAELGSLFILLKKYDDAHHYLEKSIELKPTLYANALLIILYHERGDYQAAVAAFERYAKVDKAAYGNEALVLPIVRAYTQLGNFVSANNLLNVLTATNPASKNSADYKETVNLIKAKLGN